MRHILLVLFPLLILGCHQDTSTQALGTLERDRVTFSATAGEIIRELPVKEGEAVNQGQVLVRLDSRNQEAVLAHAVAEQSRAEAYLDKLSNGERPEDIAAGQARVARAKAQLVESQKNYKRKSELVAKKLISQSEKDSALAARDSAKAELDSANEEFGKLTAGARPEDIAQAKAQLQAAQADVALQSQKLEELTIVATRDGILDNLPYNLGERVPANAIVAVIQANRVPYARVYVPASYRLDFVPGKQVTVNVDGSADSYQGKVRWVASEASFTPYYALTEEERSRLMYLAEVDLEERAVSLPSGVPVKSYLRSAANE
ncbi:HlyD family secretion protein [Vibrio sonorensis]|uniref:HlyD family secretion protein n=1 Tax=Vibrio sonorensis TaxID=1004316 RepID=UPI0008D9C8CA|nr:HlyD family efflux transporter periplasmic adaptor subunit [Vibrio sonorensis]